MSTAVPPTLRPPEVAQGFKGIGFTPELELLLACCAHVSEVEKQERIAEILRQPPQWDRVLQLAQNHGVMPRVFAQLCQVGEPVPASVLDELRKMYGTNVRQTLWMAGELLRDLEHLEAQGIEAMPYKGPVLAEMLYADLGMRQFGDLDILVRSRDALQAKVVMCKLGYETSLELTPQQERAYVESGYEFSFYGGRNRNLVEIQWRVLPGFYTVDFAMEDFFRRKIVQTVAGQSVRTLCWEDLALVLSVHAAKHVWVKLAWVCDFAALVALPKVKWDRVQEEARRLGIERILFMNFFLAHKLLGVAPPLQMQPHESEEVEKLAAEILPIIVHGAEYNTESIAYFRLMMNLRERWQDRIRFFWRLASTPSTGEWAVVKLPGFMFPFYRGVRLFRLARRFLWGASRS